MLFAANQTYFRDNEDFFCDVGDKTWLCSRGLPPWPDRLGAGGPGPRPQPACKRRWRASDRFGVLVDAIDPLRYLGLIACAAGDLDDAAVWFGEMVTRLRQGGSRAALAVGLADVATLAAARGAWQPAVRLFAKAEALLQAEAAAFSLPARDHYEQAHARATEALGDAARAAAVSRPCALAGAGSGGGRGGAGAGPRWGCQCHGRATRKMIASVRSSAQS